MTSCDLWDLLVTRQDIWHRQVAWPLTNQLESSICISQRPSSPLSPHPQILDWPCPDTSGFVWCNYYVTQQLHVHSKKATCQNFGTPVVRATCHFQDLATTSPTIHWRFLRPNMVFKNVLEFGLRKSSALQPEPLTIQTFLEPLPLLSEWLAKSSDSKLSVKTVQ